MMEIAGTDPRQAMENIFNLIEQGGLCPAFATLARKTLHILLGGLATDWSLRMLAPAILHRLNRCNAADREALFHMVGGSPRSHQSEELKSIVIRTNIIASELLGPGINFNEALAFSKQSFFSTDLTLSATHAREDGGWPPYPLDGCADRFPDTDLPILILNGDLDPNTHVDLARFTAEAYDRPHQRLVVMPGVPHGAIFESRMQNDYHDRINTCAMELAFQFFENPQKSLDRSCLEQMIQPDFSGTTPWALEAAKTGFGRNSVWD